MSDLTRAWSIENLRLAWQRVRSNPDRNYKSHFRSGYSAYAIADEAQLAHLRDRLRRSIYQPVEACKLYLPKPSGILRPYSLLCVEDQIVYQALANVVAEKLFPHARHLYLKEVFGHLYAGPANRWFYRKWSEGYKAFNKAAERAFAGGYKWAASFDLTAFYDSIDHHVLRQMLAEIGVDRQLATSLTEMLTEWTATSTRIYHNHGIPQGPLSSGLIAETVLRHFDQNHKTRFDSRYLRYVDDIRLFAKREDDLRHCLVKLDRLSKDIGLFPQSGKIHIHKVVRIEDELKSISNPPEPAIANRAVDQPELRRRLAQLAPGRQGYAVQDATKFKYLAAHATASSQVADRLWKVYEAAPHYYPQLATHLAKFEILPARQATRLSEAIEAQELYPAVRAELIRAGIGRFPRESLRKARALIKALWKPKVQQPDLSAAIWSWLQEQSHLTSAQQRYALTYAGPSWLLATLHYETKWLDMGAAQRETLLNHSLRSSSADVALAAAWIASFAKTRIARPIREIHPQAKILLKELGVVRRANPSVCGIRSAIHEMAGQNIAVNWRKLFGRNYKQAEAQIVMCKGYFKTNPTAWFNATDSFIDWLWVGLFAADPSLGTYQIGNVGGISSSARLRAKHPALHKLLNLVHGKRLESHLSHAVTKATQRPTRTIPFRWLSHGAVALRRAAIELLKLGY